MIYTSENNWYTWSYGCENNFGRQLGDLPLHIRYGKLDKEVDNFKKELHKAAASTLDHYPGLKPSIFFSGGVDSEIILRAYIDIGANPDIYVVRYENDINIYDVSYAIAISNSLGLKCNIIDFDLLKFYENDAERISEESQIDRPRMLPHLKFTEGVDGLIIVGHGDVGLGWFRTNSDYSAKGTWLAEDFEHDLGCDKYTILKNRSAIYQWFKWTPGLIISATQLTWFKKLINDEYYGKMGINSTKIIGFREAYPYLMNRNKKTGFENIDSVILEFEEFLKRKYNGLPYRNSRISTLDELYLEILGHTSGI